MNKEVMARLLQLKLNYPQTRFLARIKRENK